MARLVQLRRAAGDLEGALGALEQAVAADPVAEELYRRVMGLQAELGRPDAVKRTYRLLARRLAHLDVDPDPETEQLVSLTCSAGRARDQPLVGSGGSGLHSRIGIFSLGVECDTRIAIAPVGMPTWSCTEAEEQHGDER